MIKIALTGNIASGKSTVQNFIAQLGFKVFDTDACAHKILNNSDEIKNSFIDYNIFNNDGSINRTELGKIVFNDKNLKTKLENIIHPKIKMYINQFFDENTKEKACFVAIPLLFEANMQNLFDKIILIYTDDNIRKERLINRNNYSVEYAKIRMESQISQDKKLKLSDFVIYNNNSVGELCLSVKKLLKEDLKIL